MLKETTACRICGNTELISVLNLGDQVSTGVFPKSKEEKIVSMPLELVKCMVRDPEAHCGLLQLKHSGDLSEFYGHNYGYRSGLNRSMVQHLNQKVSAIQDVVDLKPGDFVVDIGSNDSTLLQGYKTDGVDYVGIDPTGIKFEKYYPPHIQLIPDFFSAKAIQEKFGDRKAKVVTSISMFYDLEAPMQFMKEVFDVLDPEGIWVLEQSYMPTMLEMNSYDTVCHEHLEYYALRQIKWMADRVGFRILDVELNGVNGGSFSITMAKKDSHFKGKPDVVQTLLAKEDELGLDTLKPYEEFRERTAHHQKELRQFLKSVRDSGKKIFGYGASTKGNVVLQYCGLTEEDLPYIAEVNEDKFGSFTPGTKIPIISEKEAKSLKPDYFLVLPWHFKNNFLEREKDYLESGGQLVFPLPKVESVGKPS